MAMFQYSASTENLQCMLYIYYRFSVLAVNIEMLMRACVCARARARVRVYSKRLNISYIDQFVNFIKLS